MKTKTIMMMKSGAAMLAAVNRITAVISPVRLERSASIWPG